MLRERECPLVGCVDVNWIELASLCFYIDKLESYLKESSLMRVWLVADDPNRAVCLVMKVIVVTAAWIQFYSNYQYDGSVTFRGVSRSALAVCMLEVCMFHWGALCRC
jgi:hypothetical protein